MATTTSTPALAAPNASGTLAITAASVNAGTGGLPLFAGPVNAAVIGIYITASPDFSGGFTLQRHGSGYQAGATDQPQSVVRGDEKFLAFAGPGPIASLSGQNTVTLTLTSYTAGSLTMSVVQ